MNKSYKSIWNEALGTYVAAAETAVAAGRKTSSKRRARRDPLRAGGGMLALEQRIVFDAAVAGTMVEVQSAPDAFDAGDLVDDVDGNTEAAKPEVAAASGSDDAELDSGSAPSVNSEDSGEGSVEQPQSVVEGEVDESGDVNDQVVSAQAGATPISDEMTKDEGDSAEEMDGGASTVANEILVIDASVQDIEAHTQDFTGQVFVLDGQSDGVEQLAAILTAQQKPVTALHILSHGVPGQVSLGSSTLSTESISAEHADEMSTISTALAPDADILLYGCDVGDDAKGIAFVEALAEATGADVAASSDDTGHAELGGNWNLEVSHGQIDAELFTVADWQGMLGTSIAITTSNVLSTGLGFTVSAYTATGAPAAIGFNTTPSGFGVAGAASGADAEIGEINGRSERLEVSFEGQVTSTRLWLAWLASGESAQVQMYSGSSLVGTWVRNGGTDTVDGPFTLTAAGGVAYDRLVFSAPTANASTGDDFLVNRVEFVLMRPPIDGSESVSTAEEAPISGNLLGNASDPDSDPVRVTQFAVNGNTISVPAGSSANTTIPGVGSITISSNGGYTFSPQPDWNGTVPAITYTVSDSDGLTDTSTLNITVTPEQDAFDDSASTTSAQPVVIDVLGNDTFEGSPESVSAVTQGTNGAVVVNADGTITYTPNAGFVGTDSFTYTVSTPGGVAETATVVVTVGANPVNDPTDEGDDPVTPPTIVLPEAPVTVDDPSPPQSPDRTDGAISPRVPAVLPVPSPLYVFKEVGSSQAVQSLALSGANGMLDAASLAELEAKVPEALLFPGEGGDLTVREHGYGEVIGINPALHVQHAVRHQPVTSEHGLFVQHVVRSSQLEARMRDASIASQTNSAAVGVSTLFDAFALGTPHPELVAQAAQNASAEEPTQASSSTAEVAPQAAEKPVSDAAVDSVENKAVLETQPTIRAHRAAAGFGSQLERAARDRFHGARPMTRAVAKA